MQSTCSTALIGKCRPSSPQRKCSSGDVMLVPVLQEHVWRMRLLAVLLRAQVCGGDSWPDALDTARRLTPFYKRLYPKAGTATGCAMSSPGG